MCRINLKSSCWSMGLGIMVRRRSAPLIFRMGHYEVGFVVANHQTAGSLKASLGDQNTPPQVSAVSYAADPSNTSLDSMLIAVLFDNGTVAVHWQNSVDAAWNMGIAPAANLSALAVNFDLQAYCLTDGRIQEWQIDRSVPTNWTLIGNVTNTPE